MTHQTFIQSPEYLTASESAKYVYNERLAILCEDRTPDYFEHLLAYSQFVEAVEVERLIKEGLSGLM